jgi:hypothetical protein
MLVVAVAVVTLVQLRPLDWVVVEVGVLAVTTITNNQDFTTLAVEVVAQVVGLLALGLVAMAVLES